MAQQQPAAPLTESLARGVTFEQLDNIYVFTLADVSRASIDAWADKVQELIHNDPSEHPLLMLHHFNSQYATFTPYLKARSDGIETSGRNTYAAIVLPRSVLTNVMASLLPRLSRSGLARLFSSRQEALDWLRECNQP